MKQGPNSRRSRGRGNGKRQPKNYNFDSNGPEGRVRGNAQQVLDKYLALARDAQAAGDRVTTENYFQHAEHYYRILHPADANGQRPADGNGQRPADGNAQKDPQTDNAPTRVAPAAAAEAPKPGNEAPPEQPDTGPIKEADGGATAPAETQGIPQAIPQQKPQEKSPEKPEIAVEAEKESPEETPEESEEDAPEQVQA